MSEPPPDTLHLTPLEDWKSQRTGSTYIPAGFEAEGFIHCTDGEVRVVEVANRYYTGDPRDFCVLTLSRKRIEAKVIYEDEEQVYPHIYGPLNINAVMRVRRMLRQPDGTFLGIGTDLIG